MGRGPETEGFVAETTAEILYKASINRVFFAEHVSFR